MGSSQPCESVKWCVVKDLPVSRSRLTKSGSGQGRKIRGGMTTKSKYRNKFTEYDGKLFHSKREARRYADLKVMEKAGLIRNLELQKRYFFVLGGLSASDRNYQKPLKYTLYVNSRNKLTKGRNVAYIADFVYERLHPNKTHYEVVVEDCKGFKNDMYKLKKALMKWFYDIDVYES